MAAGDFYFAINATFRFFLDNYGEIALDDYWRALGGGYYAPLAARFRAGGLDEAARYWSGFFAQEPGGEVAVTRTESAVEIDVAACPAITWLRRHGRKICPGYCRHCRHVSEAIAAQSGMAFTLEGGDGTCRQTFALRQAEEK